MRLRAVAVILLLLAACPTNRDVLAEDENADLEIKLVNVPLANGQRDIQVQVKNVSKWWADQFTVTVETVKPTPGNQVKRQFDDADPGQTRTFTYTLGAGCNGQVVKAEVTAAKNYAGVPESNLNNNKTGEVQVCPAAAAGSTGAETDTNRQGLDPNQPKPIDQSTVQVDTKPSGDINASEILPEPLRRGPHTYTFDPSAERTIVSHETECGESPYTMFSYSVMGTVGWEQHDYYDQSCWAVHQTAVNFDLDDVGQTQYRNPTWVAVMRYTEGKGNWRRDNRLLSRGDCVQVLGLATEEWRDVTLDTLFPNTQVLAHTPGVQEWYITDYVRRMIDGELPDLGFVLRGGNESPEGHGESSCLSVLLQIQLVVTYTVN